jgi:uncharacterized membrane protein YfcA
MNETPTTRIQKLWQCQPVEGIKMSADEVRRRAARFEKKISWRNLREYAAGGIAMVWFGFLLVRAHDPLARIAFGLLIAGLVFVLYRLHRNGRARNLAEVGDAACLQFYRSELERQRDLISNVWPWYLGPLVPGLVMLTIASAWSNPHLLNLAGLTVGDLFAAGVLFFIWKLNSRAARSLQKQIDELRTEGQ